MVSRSLSYFMALGLALSGATFVSESSAEAGFLKKFREKNQARRQARQDCRQGGGSRRDCRKAGRAAFKAGSYTPSAAGGSVPKAGGQ
ncbi:MAG: hypothetical protein JNL01_15075 [Bdellovibrionales bacterium]|nr:hypothetical protein [Bdellovibrionales bacterium]